MDFCDQCGSEAADGAQLACCADCGTTVCMACDCECDDE